MRLVSTILILVFFLVSVVLPPWHGSEGAAIDVAGDELENSHGQIRSVADRQGAVVKNDTTNGQDVPISTPEQKRQHETRNRIWRGRVARHTTGMWVCIGFALLMLVIAAGSVIYYTISGSSGEAAMNRPGRTRSPSMLSDAFGRSSTSAIPVSRRSAVHASGSAIRDKSSSSSSRRKKSRK